MTVWNPLSWFAPQSRAPETKASAAGPAISYATVGQPVWTPRNYEALAREGYVQNPVGFRCAKLIASNGASVNWLLMDAKGDEIETHPILDLLTKPNPAMGGAAFMESVYAYLLLAGNSYLEAVGPRGKPPRELWAPRPDRMKVIAGSHGLPAGYEYTHGQVVRWDVDQITGKSPVLHLKEFHPTNDWYGMSRIEAAAYGIDRHTAAAAHNTALLQNGARPSGALVFEPVKMPDGSVQTAPESVIKAAERDMAGHTGPSRAGKPLIFGGNVKWEEMGLSPKDMDFGVGKDDAARDICVAFGVPHILIVPGASTYNNVREAKLELWEDTILPMIDLTCDALNNWLCPMFGSDLRLGVDLDSISALEPRRESKRKSTVELLDKGLIDNEEARAALDYEPWAENAVQKVDASVLTALVGAMDSMGSMPLIRYAKSVGLFRPGMTDDEILAEVTAHLGGDDDLEDGEPPPGDDDAEDEAIGTKSAVRTLYISRPLLNAAEFLAWAKDQGFTAPLMASDLHTTIAFSKTPLDWSKLEPDNESLTVTSKAGRKVEPLGDKGAVVLHFASNALTARWREVVKAGASWDFPGYQPHVSITYDGGALDLSKVQPFPGNLVFGPEVFAEVQDDWAGAKK